MRINYWKEFFGFVALAISALFTPLDGQARPAARQPVATKVEYALVVQLIAVK